MQRYDNPAPSGGDGSVDNRGLAELLARGAEEQEPRSHRQRAMLHASRAALDWPVEAAELHRQEVALTQLPAVGTWLAHVIGDWLSAGVWAPAPDPIRRGFLSRTEAERVIARSDALHRAVRSDLQMHTLSSDGHATLEAMARRCIELGYTHMAVTDHSHGLRIAHGMDAATLAQQAVEVRTLNALFADEGIDFHIMHGIEMNLSPDGEGDVEQSVLEGLDIVLGAFHSKLRLVEDQTQRYVEALRSATFDVLAHPRGRMYNRRIGLDADWDRVFEAAAESGVAMEVDAYIDRQDLDIELLRRAANHDLWIAVDTDAHHPIDLESMTFGVAALSEAGIRSDRVLNTLSAADLREWVHARRARARHARKQERGLSLVEFGMIMVMVLIIGLVVISVIHH